MMQSGRTDVCLVQVPVWGVNLPPMSLALLGACLRAQGVGTALVDLNAEIFSSCPPDCKTLWDNASAHLWMQDESFRAAVSRLGVDWGALARRILSTGARLIGFSVAQPTLRFASAMMRALRREAGREVVLFAGGKAAGFDPEWRELADTADYFFPGEAEEALPRFARLVLDGRPQEDFSRVPGVLRPGFESLYRPCAPVDLSKIPAPDYGDLPPGLYPGGVIGVFFNKGCRGNCLFCEDKPFQGACRVRPPEHVAREIAGHVRDRGVRDFWFHDLAVNGDYAALERLCRLLIAARLDIRWIALASPEGRFPERLFGLMRRAGCTTLNFGVESGSDEVLRRMNKRRLFGAREAARVMRQARRAGIDVQPNFIVGYPGEGEREFDQTLRFIRENRDAISGVTNINTCLIPRRSLLMQEADKFGVEAVAGLIDPVRWRAGELDYAARLDRARRAVELVRELGFDLFFSNLSETGATAEPASVPRPGRDVCAVSSSPAPRGKRWLLARIFRLALRAGLLRSREVLPGLEFSEARVFPLEAWAVPSAHATSCFGAPDNVARCPGSAAESHWRDFTGRAGVRFAVGRGGAVRSVCVRVFDNSYRQGAGGCPTAVFCRVGDGPWREVGSFVLGGRPVWLEHVFALPEEFSRARVVSVLLDDGANALRGFGKSVSKIALGGEEGSADAKNLG